MKPDNDNKKNSRPAGHLLIDAVCCVLVLAALAAAAFLNAFQTDRPAVSEKENRTLAAMPEFSLSALADGSYFSDLSLFISDTFPARDTLIAFSEKMDGLRGLEYRTGKDGESDFAVLDGSGADSAETEAEGAADALEEAFGKLDETDPKDVEEELSSDLPVNAETDAAEPSDGDDPDDAASESSEKTETSEEEQTTAAGSAAEARVEEVTSLIIPKPEPPKPAETEAGEKGEETTEAETEVIDNGIRLSSTSLKLTQGSTAVITAEYSAAKENDVFVWTTSNAEVVTLSPNEDGGVTAEAVGCGSAIIVCKFSSADPNVKSGDGKSCEITVVDIGGGVTSETQAGDFLGSGLFLYNGAVYTQTYFVKKNAEYYTKAAEYYKKLFGEETRVSIVPGPVSAMVIDDETVKNKVADQSQIIAKIGEICPESVNMVDTYSELFAHRNEYLFFRSDHHWTARGAYYAYRAFAESVGFEPVDIDDLECRILSTSYTGSMYSFTGDERVKRITDVVEAYIPSKECKMTVTTATGQTVTYTGCITNSPSYLAFIAGDNPYTVINVPDNPQELSCLVLKDSYGNAFVPYLCEHYGNIIVIDPRHFTQNVYDLLGEYGLSDIIFMNNLQQVNSYAFARMYFANVGVSLGS